jgi:hypothetical protein
MRRLFRPGDDFGWNLQDLPMPHVAEHRLSAVAFLLPDEVPGRGQARLAGGACPESCAAGALP